MLFGSANPIFRFKLLIKVNFKANESPKLNTNNHTLLPPPPTLTTKIPIKVVTSSSSNSENSETQQKSTTFALIQRNNHPMLMRSNKVIDVKNGNLLILYL
jgi:hypothetical protein